jgi:hypothetical protein
MLNLTGPRRFWIACFRVDFRRGFDGLLADAYLAKRDPFAGDVLIFISRDRKKAKILAVDDTGIWVMAKRFFGGGISHRFYGEKSCREVSQSEAMLFLEGTQYIVHKRLNGWPPKIGS